MTAQGRKILVADDEVPITCVMARKLERAGYTVLVAHDGEEALATARRERPDLVITDLQMPYLNGLDLSIALKQDPGTAQTPVIMLTARGYLLTEEQIRSTNIRHMQSKPFSAREILDRVTQIFGQPTGGAAEQAA